MGSAGSATTYLSDPSAAISGYGLGGFGGMTTLGGLTGIPGGQGLMDGHIGLGHRMGLGHSAAGGAGLHSLLQDPFEVAVANSGHPNPERQGSLSQEQQMELMDVLETEGMGEINTFLSMDMSLDGAVVSQNGMQW